MVTSAGVGRGYVRVAGWDRFQNADVFRKSGGRPPWIKLYTRLLSDPDSPAYLLSDAEFGQLARVWLVAALTGNRLPADPGWLRARIGSRRPVPLARFLELGLLEPIPPDELDPAGTDSPLHAHDTPAAQPQHKRSTAPTAKPLQTRRASREHVASQSRQEVEVEVTPLPPFTCTHPECGGAGPTFTSRRRLLEHLATVHWLSPDQATHYLDTGSLSLP